MEVVVSVRNFCHSAALTAASGALALMDSSARSPRSVNNINKRKKKKKKETTKEKEKMRQKKRGYRVGGGEQLKEVGQTI